jgi:hypothetical protein
MTDHDRLFKELLTTFFLDFIELFFPDILPYLDPDSITFLDKELFTDITAGQRYETDILAQARFKNQETFFLIHVENQSTALISFGKRMFRYFARLYEKYDYPIYPIVIFSYDKPQKPATTQFQIEFPGFIVNTFNYRVLQLNQLNWRDFLDRPNPIASALMAKMRIDPSDRPKVKAQCLRLLVTLRLDPARMQLISGFVDTYLRLNQQEEQMFQKELDIIEPETRKDAMEIVTSWMERGLELGRQEGLEQGLLEGREAQMALVLRLLQRRVGQLPAVLTQSVRQLDAEALANLGEALFDFESIADSVVWLILSSPPKQRKTLAILLLEGCLGDLDLTIKARVQGLKKNQLQQLGEALLAFETIADLEAWLAVQPPG